MNNIQKVRMLYDDFILKGIKYKKLGNPVLAKQCFWAAYEKSIELSVLYDEHSKELELKAYDLWAELKA